MRHTLSCIRARTPHVGILGQEANMRFSALAADGLGVHGFIADAPDMFAAHGLTLIDDDAT